MPSSLAIVKTAVLSVSDQLRFVATPKMTDLPLGVQSPSCKEGNLVSSKSGAQLVLKALLGMTINPDCVASQNDDQAAETIVEAQAVPAVEGIQVELNLM